MDANVACRSARVDPKWFHTKESDCKVDFEKLEMNKAKPSFYSTSATLIGRQVADIQIYHDAETWGPARKFRCQFAWLGAIGNMKHKILIRLKSGVEWFFALWHYDDSSVLVWLARISEVPSHPGQ